MLRLICLSFTTAVLAAGASAQTPSIDTFYFMLRDGIVMTTQGHVIQIDYNDDGSFSGEAAGTNFEGTYRIDGAQLCTTSSLAASETCTVYPEGMQSGDEFEIVSPALGSVRIRIRTPEENRAANTPD